MTLFGFADEFSAKLRVINEMESPEDIKAGIGEAAQTLERFYKQFRAANMSNYDRKKLSGQFVRMEQYLAATKQKKVPRVRFEFSSRKYVPKENVEQHEAKAVAEFTELDIVGLRDETIQLSKEVHSIQDCSNCTFVLIPLKQLFIFRCTNCRFLNLNTESACFFECVEQSSISGRAHELRLSNCADCLVKVAVTGPIIEKCRKIVFAKPDEFQAGWDAVVDFSWLRTDVESGNFSVLTCE